MPRLKYGGFNEASKPRGITEAKGWWWNPVSFGQEFTRPVEIQQP